MDFSHDAPRHCVLIVICAWGHLRERVCLVKRGTIYMECFASLHVKQSAGWLPFFPFFDPHNSPLRWLLLFLLRLCLCQR